ncbi:MAG: DUF4252 domain-containing protein [Acidobacteria bacterium]|nr:DUF4252 domain-containing protein [Acidobacteriota bacterium]
MKGEDMTPSLKTMRDIIRLLLLPAFVTVLSVYAQDARLQINHLDRLAPRAIEAIEITLDETSLRAVTKLATLSAREQAKLMEQLNRLKGVYMRGYEFANDGEYSEADVDALRAQLNAPGWQRIVEVRGRRGEKDEVYLMPQNQEIVGFAAISTEPRKLCVINIVGQIDLVEMNLLDKQFEFKRCGMGLGGRQRNR